MCKKENSQSVTSLKSDLYALLLFFILAVIFYSPFLFQGKAFLAADTLLIKYPWKYYQTEEIEPKNPLLSDPVDSFYPKDYIQNKAVKKGRLNLWNPYILGGYPNLASGTPPGWLYPIKLILHRFFEPWRAHGYSLFIHTFIMGVGFYLYSKAVGLSCLGALIAGISWMFNGYILVWLESEHFFFLSSWLPFILYFSERFINERNFNFVVIGGFFLGLVLLSSHFQFSIFVLSLLGYTFLYKSFVLFRNAEKSKFLSLWVGFFIIVFLGIGIASIQLIPSTELLFNSQRTSYKDFQDLLNKTATMPVENLITLIFPFFFLKQTGFFWLRRLSDQVYFNYNELCIYGGVVTFLLALFAITKNKDHLKNYFLIIAVTSILFAMGTYLYYPVYLIPFFKTLNPTRVLYLFAFAISGLAGIGADYLYNLSNEKKKLPVLFVSFISIISLLIVVFYIFKKAIVKWYIGSFWGSFWEDSAAVIKSATKVLLSHYSFGNTVFLLPILFLISSITLIVLILKRGTKPVYWSILISLMFIEAVFFGWRYNPLSYPSEIYPVTDSIKFLREQKGIFRIALHPELIHNSFMPFRIQNIGGYDSMYPRRYGEFMTVVEHGTMYSRYRYGRWVALSNFNSPLIDLLNVRYILFPPYLGLRNTRFRLVYDNDLKIYENLEMLPRAFMVGRYLVMPEEDILKTLAAADDNFSNMVILEEEPAIKRETNGKGEVLITQYEPGRVLLKVTSFEGGILLFTENFYPGWKAYVDGKKKKVLRANYTFMAVSVEPGTHVVEFRYDPLSFKIGGGLTLLTLTVMLMYIGVNQGRNKDKQLT